MILVDTSIWINYFSKKPQYKISELGLCQIVVAPPVIQEVLQGVKEDKIFKRLQEQFLAMPCVNRKISLELYLEATKLFRLLKKKGKTVRSSTDCLLAVIALNNDLTVWHNDRDYDQIAKLTALKVWKKKQI